MDKHAMQQHRRAPGARTRARRRQQRGAAFLIAIAILVILVAIGTTFFSVSRLELKTATNVTNAVRVDLLNEAANTIAIHHLNQYFFRSPSVTSTDHSFKSLFDGAAFVGKSWARRKEPSGANPTPIGGKSLQAGGVPEVDVNRIQSALDAYAQTVTGSGVRLPVVLYWPEDGHRESIFRGSRSNNWLYIPRLQSAYPLNNADPMSEYNADFILLYDYEGDVTQLRNGLGLSDVETRRVELRVEDGQQGGLGTLLASTPAELNALNAFLASSSVPAFNDLQFAYFSDFDPFNTRDAAERQARYPFATAAIYQSRGEPESYGENPNVNRPHGYPEEQVDSWSDVDNDGDGLRDSIWLPIPQDVFFADDTIDNDLNGIVDETQDNLKDDDGDGKADYQNLSPAGVPAEDPNGVILHDEDEAIEAGTFVYNGLGPFVDVEGTPTRAGDGFDNDGNGLVDEPEEDRLFLTSPLPGVRIPLDLDGDGVASTVEIYRRIDPISRSPIGDTYRVLNPAVVVGPEVRVPGYPQPLTSADVDVIDNDYDLLLNDYFAYAYLGPYEPAANADDPDVFYDPTQGWQPVGNWDSDLLPNNSRYSAGAFANQILKSYTDINRRLLPGTIVIGTRQDRGVEWFSNLDPDEQEYILSSLRITHSGEPVCDLVGRAAITITDEASKVNLNVAGAEVFNPFSLDGVSVMQPSFNEGVGPHEYDLMTLPPFGNNADTMASLTSKIAGYRNGGPQGVHLPQDATFTDVPNQTWDNRPGPWREQPGNQLLGNGNLIDNTGRFDFAQDVSLPGLGRVDDNGDALLRSIDGIDNDGNGLSDEGFVSPADIPAQFDEVLDFRNGDSAMLLNPSADRNDKTVFSDPAQYAFAQKWFRMGAFEGVDEPGERQLFSPLRNPQAESDQKDNNPEDNPLEQSFADEVGELGDRVFQSENELTNVAGVGDDALAQLERVTTVHSSDRNVKFIPTETGVRALNATDLNRASAKQLAAKLLLGSEVVDSLTLVDKLAPIDVLDNSPAHVAGVTYASDAIKFAEGLRQGDTRLIAHDPRPDANGPYRSGDFYDGGFLFDRQTPQAPQPGGVCRECIAAAAELPLDQELQYLQLSVNAVDARDAGYGRSALTTERVDRVQKSTTELGLEGLLGRLSPGEEVFNNAIVQNWPMEATPSYAIDEEELFPTEEAENQLKDVLNAGNRKLQITDRWWQEVATTPNANGIERPEQRHISYTAAGVESIRINELMVRPVRRVEAEAFPQTVNAFDPKPAFLLEDPIADAAWLNQAFWNLDPSPFGEQQVSLLGSDLAPDRPGRYPHPSDSTAPATPYPYLFATTDVDPDLDGVQVEALTPEFKLTRRVLDGINYSTPDGDVGLDGPPINRGDTSWQLDGNGILGDATILRTDGTAHRLVRKQNLPDRQADVIVPDVMEFIFSEPNPNLVRWIGLPNGRYYLAVKLEGEVADVLSSGRLRYSIKYRAPGDNTITEDIAARLQDIHSASNGDQDTAFNDYVNYLEGNFHIVPASHLANGPGEPANWVFLDAMPPVGANDSDEGYFTEFPPAYHISLDGVSSRVSVAYAGLDTATGENRWQFRLRIADPAELTRMSFIDSTNGNIIPGYDIAASGQYAEFLLDDAALSNVMSGAYRLQVQFFGGVIVDRPFEPSGNPLLSSHTVSIPPFLSGYTLSVALTTSPFPNAIGPQPAPDLAGGEIGVNFFDFSQEPDHEYIELTNISDDEIDLSNWKLEVGPEHRPGIDWYPFNTEWRVPSGTRISAGGMLLLTFNKFDSFDDVNAEPTIRMPEENDSLITRNGIGMARTDNFQDVLQNAIPDIYRVTVPPLRDNSWDERIYSADSFYSDISGSVFDRSDNPRTPLQNEFADYVDDYGAGLTTAFALQRGITIGTNSATVLDERRAAEEVALSSTPNPTPDFPWDRIVELENLRLWQKDDALLSQTNSGNVWRMKDIDDVDMLARFVLRGGVLPNYPDHDGIDNDGDGSYMVGNTLVPGILEEDMVDNDLDGFVDERARDIDFDNDNTVDLAAWPFSGEGVDEGNLGLFTGRNFTGTLPGPNYPAYRPYGPGSFGIGTLPFAFNPSRLAENQFFNNIFDVDTPLLDGPVDGAVVNLVPAPIVAADWNFTGGAVVSAGQIDIVGTGDARLNLAAQSQALGNRQRYLVEIAISQFTDGQVQILLGNDESDAWRLTHNDGPGVYRDFRFAQFDSTNAAEPTIWIRSLLNTTNVSITSITLIPIGLSNRPINIAATGETIGSFAAGILQPAAAGNFNQNYLTYQSGLLPASEDTLYLGSDLDPPDWKAFVERRNFPGDNVVVSLYTASGEVADRVTYREFDVIDRTIDDVVGSPYRTDAPTPFHDREPTEGVVFPQATYVSLHPDYPTFWLPNQMGLDFYRALERKNPIAPGDKFGTQNRWQATDGNYDDWSDSLSFFARRAVLADGDVTKDEYYAFPSLLAQLGYDGGSAAPADFIQMSRFFQGGMLAFQNGLLNVEDSLRLFGHAMFGSPLRMNIAYRKTSNPVDPLKFDAQPPGSLPTIPRLTGAYNIIDGTETMALSQFMNSPATAISPGREQLETRLASNLWQNRMTELITNEPYNAPVDVARAPLFSQEHEMINTAPVRINPALSPVVFDNYLHDELRLNFFNDADLAYNDIEQRSALAGQSEKMNADAERPMNTVLSMGATDSLVLTVAQANFIPIRPDRQVLDANAQDYPVTSAATDKFQDLLRWRALGGAAEPPAAWTPVFTYAFDEEFLPANARNTLVFPYYPPKYDGLSNGNYTVDPAAVLFPPGLVNGTEFQQAFIAPAIGAAIGVGAPDPILNPMQLSITRIPLEKRVAMYVSKNRNKNANTPMTRIDGPTHRPEALWVWDAEDGLENGEYEVYIGTFMPKLAQKIVDMRDTARALSDIPAAEDLLENLTPPSGLPEDAVATRFAEQNIARRDPVNFPNDTTAPFTAEYEIDVLTDPTDALGVRPCVNCPSGGPAAAADSQGLIHPDDWEPNLRYKAREDGYIFYGTDAAHGWQPIIVRVTNNFLALRVRNVGGVNDTGVVSHVVLSPRKRTPGRININTANFQIAEMRTIGDTSGDTTDRVNRKALVNALAGLPGIRNLGGEISIPFDVTQRFASSMPLSAKHPQDPDHPEWLPGPLAMSFFNNNLWDIVGLGSINVTATDGIPTPIGVPNAFPPQANPNGILPDATGGRSSLEVVAQDDPVNAAQAARYLLMALMQLGRTEHQDGRYYESIGDLSSAERAYIPADALAGNGPVYPLSNNSDAEARAREIEARLRRLAASITTRSDVFEILTTVQSGYGIDTNNDGHYNYRDNNEFITTAETRSRMVYERRVPTDNSDEADVSKQ